MTPVSAASSAALYSDPASLQQMARDQQLSEQAKLAEVGRQFESILVGQLLKQSLEPMFEGVLTGEGPGQGLYRQMVTDTLSNALTQNANFGFSTALQQQYVSSSPAASSEDVKP